MYAYAEKNGIFTNCLHLFSYTCAICKMILLLAAAVLKIHSELMYKSI